MRIREGGHAGGHDGDAQARRPISGRERTANYLARALSRNLPKLRLRLDVAEVNGEPALLAFDGDTQITDDRIAALRILANPDKLRFLAEQLSHPADLSGL